MTSEYGDGLMLPGIPYEIPLNMPEDLKKRRDEIYANRIGLYLVGCVDYTDSSAREPYRTKFLERLFPRNNYFAIMPLGNEVR